MIRNLLLRSLDDFGGARLEDLAQSALNSFDDNEDLERADVVAIIGPSGVAILKNRTNKCGIVSHRAFMAWLWAGTDPFEFDRVAGASGSLEDSARVGAVVDRLVLGDLAADLLRHVDARSDGGKLEGTSDFAKTAARLRELLAVRIGAG